MACKPSNVACCLGLPWAQALLRESQAANERLQKEYNTVTNKVAKMQATLEEHIHTNTQARWLAGGWRGWGVCGVGCTGP